MTDSTKLIERLKEAAQAATPQDLDTAQSADHYSDGRWIECPTCGGEGSVELHADFCNYDGKAIGVQFYGIGPEHLAAEAYFRVASPAAILELIALIEQQTKEIEDARRTAEYWKAEHNAGNAQIAALESAAKATVPKLSVWYGAMPESNGKTNWTAILHKGDLVEGHTIDRSEYPDRVRYAADCVRYLIGELPERPWILDYDADKHSGYTAPAATDNGGGRDAVTDAQVEAALAAFNAFPCPEDGSVVRTWDTDQMRAALLAALAQPLEAQADAWWQPIETAPKDGTEVLLIATLYSMLMPYPERIVGAYRNGWWSGPATLSHVTHWQTLPAAPAALSQKAGEQQ